MIRMVTALVVVGALFGPLQPIGRGTSALQPSLQVLAQTQPEATVQVIVQKTTADTTLEATVETMGGTVTRDLHLIQGFAARLKAGDVPRLAALPGVRWVSLDAPMVKVADESRPTDRPALPNPAVRRADFDSASFVGNDTSWNEAWLEIGEDDGPTAGDVAVVNFMAGSLTGLRIQGAQKGVQTKIDLTDLNGGVLSFAYRRKDFASEADYVSVEISTDGGMTWVEAQHLAGPATDEDIAVAQIDLAPYEHQTLGLRLVSSAAFSSQSKFYLDYVQVAGTLASLNLPYTVWLPAVSGGSTVGADAELPVSIAKVKFGTTVKVVSDCFSNSSYNGNYGTANWKTGWTEFDVNGVGPSAGNVNIANGELWLDDNPDTGTQPSLARSVDLSTATSAQLTFDFRTTAGVDADDIVAVEVSKNGGVTYSTLETFSGIAGTVTRSRHYDLSAFMASNTTIRFQVIQNYGSADESFVIDNVAITFANTTILDQFDSVSYTNSDGLATWAGPWVENDPYGGNGPAGGYVRVENGQLMLDWLYAYQEKISRSADLSAYTQATLTFNWQTSGLGLFESVSVLASKDGAWFTQLGTYSGSKSGSASFDISAFISSNTTIRFENRSFNWNYGDSVKIDNLQIAASGGCVQCENATKLKSSYPKSVKADQVWNNASYLQGQNMTVAVVDSGIVEAADLHAETGLSRVVARVQFASSTASSDDFYGHGTHVAGIIAGNGLDSRGNYIGIAPHANLIDVKVMDDTGVGLMSDVVAGLQWVYDHRAEYNIRVVNLSLNSTVAESYHTNPLDAAVEILWFNGIVVVTSAGNAGANAVYPPANDPFVITVGAVDDKETVNPTDDTVASFSAYGTPQGFAKPDVVAPGKDIVSLLSSDDNNLASSHPANIVTGPDGSVYFRMSGTSMAAPVVSGAAALLLQDEPNLTPDQVKYRLMATANKNWSGYNATQAGAGLVDIYAAINGTTVQSANTGVTASQLLWSGTTPVSWGSVQWGSVQWGSVQWGSVQWGSVQWGSVQWGSDYWGP
ncbi:MAG: S8 family peptidase [Anaerolineae bacterium]